MTKVVIQIPCYNEADALPITLAALPTSLPGVSSVEWLVIDDGSTDETSAVATSHGVHRIHRFPRRQGLARAYTTGLEAALDMGADIIVNTDADNQYSADDIPTLIAPIQNGRAEIVIGARPIQDTAHFSPLKKALQRLGSRVTRIVSQTTVDDAPSGFRAVSRSAAMQLHVFNDYTYTIETIIQAGQKGMAITSVPIKTNPDLRPSRLVRSMRSYISHQLLTMLRIFMTYKPFRFFALPGVLLFSFGFLIGLRFVYYYFTDGGVGHIQSVILSALLLGVGFFLMIVGLVADLVAVNRKLLEDINWRLRKISQAAPQPDNE